MLSEQNSQSEREQEVPAVDSVYDFLYYDAERIASLSSQFNNFGHLQQIQYEKRAQRKSEIGTSNSGDMEAKILGVGGKASVSSRDKTGNEYGEQQNKTYDPRWINALTFLDYLEGQSLISRDILSSTIGQIVLFCGDLNISDLRLFKDMWKSESVKKAIKQGAFQENNRAERRALEAQNKKSGTVNPVELGIDLISNLPQSIQASVSDAHCSAWATLDEKNLTASPLQLMMKHGLSIAGKWYILGILDAKPLCIPAPDIPLKLGIIPDNMGPAFVELVKRTFGKPDLSYGITPLLLFREIKIASN